MGRRAGSSAVGADRSPAHHPKDSRRSGDGGTGGQGTSSRHGELPSAHPAGRRVVGDASAAGALLRCAAGGGGAAMARCCGDGGAPGGGGAVTGGGPADGGSTAGGGRDARTGTAGAASVLDGPWTGPATGAPPLRPGRPRTPVTPLPGPLVEHGNHDGPGVGPTVPSAPEPANLAHHPSTPTTYHRRIRAGIRAPGGYARSPVEQLAGRPLPPRVPHSVESPLDAPTAPVLLLFHIQKPFFRMVEFWR